MHESIVIHHCDDDGRCAGAIVTRECIPSFVTMTKDDFFEYRHGYPLVVDDDILNNCRDIYIVDVAIDPTIVEFVEHIHELRGNEMPSIVLIDHHQTSVEWMESHTNPDHVMNLYVKKFVHMGVSGCLLTWVYGCFTDDERNKFPEFDFSEGRTHVEIGTNGRQYKIPWAVRLIDDWDVWRHELKETKYFNIGFSLVADKSPNNDIWDSVIYGDDRWLDQTYISNGRLLWDYQCAQNKRNLSHAFTATIGGHECLCLNAYGNSLIFGDLIKEFPMVCLYQYDGRSRKWKYSFYSDEETGIDVAAIAQSFGGGGHKHASGCMMSDLIIR